MMSSGAAWGQASPWWTRAIVCVDDSYSREVEGIVISYENLGETRAFFGLLQHWTTGSENEIGSGRTLGKNGSMAFDVCRRASEAFDRRGCMSHDRCVLVHERSPDRGG